MAICFPVKATDAAGRLGISLRQINYWCHKGYLQAPPPGTGHTHEIPDDEYEIAQLIATLIDAGITLPAAARAARRFHNAGKDLNALRLTRNVTITLERKP